MKKYKMLEIAPEDIVPEMVELVAFAEALVKQVNELSDEELALRKELTQLRAAAKRAKRLGK